MRLFVLASLSLLLAGTPTEARDCRLVDTVIVVDLRNRAHARILDHVWDAVPSPPKPKRMTDERTT